MPRLTRRRFLLGGSAAGLLVASGAGAALLRDKDPDDAPSAPDATPTPSDPTPTPTPSLPRGGTARLHAPAAFNFDTFDALRSGEPSVLEVLGRTHSRLLDWLDPPNAILGPSLATSWEQPEPDQLILHLDPAARWHQRPPLDGGPVEADQVRSHLRRGVDLARAGRMPALQRPQDWQRIRNVTTPGDLVRIETDGPDPFLLNTLASRFALVQAPQAVGAFEVTWPDLLPESVVGSGPFVYEGESASRLRFTAHTQGHAPPPLAALEVLPPTDLVARFRDRLLDEATFRDRRDAPAALEGNEDAVSALPRFEDSPIITTLSVGSLPWNNLNLRLALSAALNRPELARGLLAGRAQPSGPVSPAHAAFAYPETDLAPFPGYRPDLARDAADARAYWEAGGGPSLGPLTLDIPAVFDPVYAASSVLIPMLQGALGVEVRVRVDSYTVISERAASGAYGNGQLALWFGWGPPDVEPDPSRALIETYDPTSPTAVTFGYRSEPVALALAALSTASKLNERKDGVKRAQSHLLDEGGGPVLSWLLQRSETLRWNYLHAPPPTPFWIQHLASGLAIDTAHPAFHARPS